jgi:hypothetical protein
MADGRFVALIRKVSANDTYYFTINQLQAESLRRQAIGPWLGIIILAIATPMLLYGIVSWQNDARWLVLVGAVFALVGGLALAAHLFGPWTGGGRRDMAKIAKKWEGTNGRIEMLIHSPGLGSRPPNWKEPDIYDYGVERVLIVQHPLLVDLFVKNNFHSAQRALVVAADGYPNYLVPLANKLLAERADLPVFVLHDSDSAGQQTLERARRTYELADRSVTDLGLTPGDVKRIAFFKKTGARGKSYELPVDYLPFERLQTMTIACFTAGLGFNAMLIQDRTSASMGADADFG